MKLILVKEVGEFLDEEQIKEICESSNIEELKILGENIAKGKNLKSSRWEDWSLPTMGDNKLMPASKLRLKLSDNEALYISITSSCSGSSLRSSPLS